MDDENEAPLDDLEGADEGDEANLGDGANSRNASQDMSSARL